MLESIIVPSRELPCVEPFQAPEIFATDMPFVEVLSTFVRMTFCVERLGENQAVVHVVMTPAGADRMLRSVTSALGKGLPFREREH